MAPNKPVTYTTENVLAFLKEKAGTKYVCYKLAHTFDTQSESMRHTLQVLLDRSAIETCVFNRTRHYFVYSQSELAALRKAATPTWRSEYKPHTAAWNTVYEKLADFRKEPSLFGSKS